MNRIALDISGIGNTGGRNESEKESTCGAKDSEPSQHMSEKQATALREDLESEIEDGAISLNALAPIQRLSDDVLCHIFELHCQDSLPLLMPRRFFQLPAPPQITLSHVCSVWREIILDIPTVWRSIVIIPRYLTSPEIIAMVIKAANTLLSRAKRLPCSVDINFPDDTGSRLQPLWEEDWHKNIVRDLISLRKFKTLRVTFTDHHLRALLRLPDDSLLCIEDLCLGYISPYENLNKALPFDLHKLSNLTSFTLYPDPFDLYPIRDYLQDYFKFASIPGHNLQLIRLYATIPASFCLDALEHCSAVLETCSLVITADDDFTTLSPRVPVSLFQLQTLNVVVRSLTGKDELLESFLLSLRFPNLTSLTLGSFDYPLGLENLLQMVKARLPVEDTGSEHWMDENESKYVYLYCDEGEDELDDEVLDFIEEIEESGVNLYVFYYSDSEYNSLYGDWSDGY